MMGFLQEFMDRFEKRRRLKWTPPAAARSAPQEPPAQSGGAADKTFYTAEKRRLVERYTADAFGPIVRTFWDGGTDDAIRIDVAVTEPDEERDFYTLTTIGMGAHRMDVPEELAERNRAFAELCVCLPPDWDVMNDTWPFHMLQQTARLPFTKRDHLGVGNAYHGPMMRGSGFAANFVVPAATRDDVSTRLMMPNGRIVNFYLLIPVYEEEWAYIASRRDSQSFWERYSQRVGSIVVEPGRESCVDDAEPDEDEDE